MYFTLGHKFTKQLLQQRAGDLMPRAVTTTGACWVVINSESTSPTQSLTPAPQSVQDEGYIIYKRSDSMMSEWFRHMNVKLLTEGQRLARGGILQKLLMTSSRVLWLAGETSEKVQSDSDVWVSASPEHVRRWSGAEHTSDSCLWQEQRPRERL